MIYRQIQTYFILILLFTGVSPAGAQTYLYFQDSPDPVFYDFSWLFVEGQSQLELAGYDDHRFPVETEVSAHQGMNSLRLHWTSVAGGNWQAIAAGINWTAHDVSDTDTLLFYLYSDAGLQAGLVPTVFLEDVDNHQTTKFPVGDYAGDVPAGEWTRVVIPMHIFFDAGDPVDFTAIKTIGFQQNMPDNADHTLYVDDMRIFKGSGISPPVSPPQGLTAKGYDSHVYLTWQPNTEPNLGGYEIFQSTDGGANFIKRAVVGKNDSTFTHFVRSQGTNLNLQYAIKAVNTSNDPSGFSNIVQVSTYDMTDEELLDMVQEATFRYFYDFGHPVSGLARERNTSGDVVTTGGSGFGIKALLVGIERGFITRQQGVQRITRIVNFLKNADRFHGVWPHWMNGNTGAVIPFSEFDDGGDLVETAFLVQGLLAARQYFDRQTPDEQAIVQTITDLWESVEWDWYRRNNGNYLYWHWSPNYGWHMNMPVRGPNEAAIVYILAIASPTHGVPASLWQDGWAASPAYVNGNSFYGYKIWVGWDYGGPLFFTQYSYLGFDPRGIKDEYANYFKNNRNIALIDRAYCIANPKNYEGYGPNCWGLTASDDPNGYMVHEPIADRDNGTITPTAALSSMPYTPEQSIVVLKHIYRELGAKTWGNFGFYDAFNQEVDWWADSYIAIDQGPIIDMIENYRSALLWDHFMANPEIGPALAAIGFVDDPSAVGQTGHDNKALLRCSPKPVSHGDDLDIRFVLKQKQQVSIWILSTDGRRIASPATAAEFPAGVNHIRYKVPDALPPGIYLLGLKLNSQLIVDKVVID